MLEHIVNETTSRLGLIHFFVYLCINTERGTPKVTCTKALPSTRELRSLGDTNCNVDLPRTMSYFTETTHSTVILLNW